MRVVWEYFMQSEYIGWGYGNYLSGSVMLGNYFPVGDMLLEFLEWFSCNIGVVGCGLIFCLSLGVISFLLIRSLYPPSCFYTASTKNAPFRKQLSRTRIHPPLPPPCIIGFNRNLNVVPYSYL